MHSWIVTTTEDRVFVGRRILALMQEPRSDATRLGRLVDAVDSLAETVLETAEVLYEGRGRVTSATQAVTLIGYDRLERLVRRFLREEYARLADDAAEVSAPLMSLVEPRYAAI